MANQEKVEQLIKLLEKNNNLKAAVIHSLTEADYPGIASLDEFFKFLDTILTHIPTEENLMPSVRSFYYVLSKSPGDLLKKDAAFNNWIQEFVEERGNYMDTTESVKAIDTFTSCPDYKLEDYIKGPSGWQTYNQFLARQVKPGRRPVAAPCDDTVIVSPADSTFMGFQNIEKNSTITVKGNIYSITTLLEGSNFREDFAGGIFTHSFLSITDYHRFHVPVAGIIKEVRHIPATTWVTEVKTAEGKAENIDDVGFQFEHTRAQVIIESTLGLVAVMPVGMGHISSVIINAEEGVHLAKGEELGYFAFGGSDIIMLFQNSKVKFSAKKDSHYLQGAAIAEIG